MNKGPAYIESRSKRRLDIAAALFLGSLTAPLAAGVALEIMAENRTMHPFFVQPRPGRNGELVNMHKFRTLWKEISVTEPISGAKDPRASAVANVWRSSRLDELPQLYDILIGTDSICGNRRMTLEHEENCEKLVGKSQMDRWREARDISPGQMTREQVRSVFYPEHTPEIIEWRIEGGIRYPQQATLRGDIGIIAFAARTLSGRALGLMRTDPLLHT